MKKIRSRWVVLLALAFSLSAHAEGGGNDQKSTVHLGIGGGFNYTNGFGEDTSKGVPVEPVGFSFNGALTLTLFQDYPFGFQIAADYMNINTSETPYRFSSNLLSASVIPRVSFSTWQIFRHSIGLGYTFGWNVGMNSATGTSAPSVIMNGGVLDLKDWVKLGKHGVFLESKLYVLVSSTANPFVLLPFEMGIGFDL